MEFKKEKLSERKIMVRFDEGEYETIRRIAYVNHEGMGQIIRVIVRNYLKATKHEEEH